MTACTIHRRHSPVPMTSELHHCLPRAWQMLAPDTPPISPGKYQGQVLWDARGVVLCPTGHRSVHYWIVTLMHGCADARAQGSADDASALARAVKGLGRKVPPEVAVAVLAPQRWIASGHALVTLIDAHEWGMA